MTRLNLTRLSLIAAVSLIPITAFASTGVDMSSLCDAVCALVGCGCC